MDDRDGVRDFELSVLGNGADSLSDATVRAATPEEGALQAARCLKPAPTEQKAESRAVEISLRDLALARVYIFKAWSWDEDAPYDGPDWLGDTIYRSDVEKLQTVEP